MYTMQSINLFGGQGNGKRRCWYMHFNKSSLVPHPQLKLVNKFGNLNSIKCNQLVSVQNTLYNHDNILYIMCLRSDV